MESYDFSGWATKANLKCSDGRVIMKDAFKHNDGQKVPLVWNHQHNSPDEVLGHARLENRTEGVYAYCSFNDTESGKTAKELVQHGDVEALSIYANRLKQEGCNVIHGEIREVSLVLAGANPGAFIESVMSHSDEGEPVVSEEEAQIFTGDEIVIYHSDAKEDDDMADETKETKEKTVQDVIDTMNEEQKKVLYALVGMANEDNKNSDEGDDEDMKHNVFDNDEVVEDGVLTHSDQVEIINRAKRGGNGTFQTVLRDYMEEKGYDDTLAHGIFDDEEIEKLFPDYKDVHTGAPRLIQNDFGWVAQVMSKTHKSPISRIRTRFADARVEGLRAHGYQNKGDQKTVSASIQLLSRTTDPQTVYRKDQLHRDDITDITDFDIVAYQWQIMTQNLKAEIARAILVGDGRPDGDADKIHETHIRSIWNDDDFYTIHQDVDIEKARAELQGTNTTANFGENYIYAEAIITAALYSREKFKGTGTPDLYCTPHLINVMLLARDLNGRRIYSSKTDLAAALNVNAIHTVEQFEGLTRTTKDGKTKKLLGLFVNLADYQLGSTKGGEITKFDQFDIDFNTYKYLIETRVSGALVEPSSAIALEVDVTGEAEG